MARVELRGVQKTYPGGQAAVRGVDLVIEDGELVALVGPSGSGKSTTLRLIAGLEEASAGEIRIGDRVVNRVPPRDRDIAMVFQEYALYPHMTVFDNMGFGLKMRRRPPAEIDRRVREAAEVLEIPELLGRRPAELSGGQRQRVAVGRAIVRQPQVFLLDEPLSNLDAKLRGEMRAELARLHRRLATTMVFVTHDQVEALTLGQRVVVLRDGLVEQVASPLELYHHPANRFVASFVGSPPMSFLSGSIVGESGALEFRTEPGVRLPIHPSHRDALERRAGQQVVLGIRAEHLRSGNQAPSPGSAPPAGSASLEGVVDVIEPMGSELYVSLRVGDRPLMARLPLDAAPVIDRPFRLEVEMKQARFFDAESEATLV